MLLGIRDYAIELSKNVKVKCQSFDYDGKTYSALEQKSNLKKVFYKSNSKALIASPNIFSAEVLFYKMSKKYESKNKKCILLTEKYLRSIFNNDLGNKIQNYDVIFIIGLRNNDTSVSSAIRILQCTEKTVIVSFISNYFDYVGKTRFCNHNPVVYDKQVLGWGSFDLVLFQTELEGYSHEKNTDI
jgi:hypothetical protein